MIEDHGEIAIVVEEDDGEAKIVSYTLPRREENFEDGEVRNAFLAQTLGLPAFEEKDREILSSYLEKGVLQNKRVRQFHFSESKENLETGAKSVYKYKPVALKMKPVIQELPAEF